MIWPKPSSAASNGLVDEPQQCGMGPFSIVWGLALAAATLFLYNTGTARPPFSLWRAPCWAACMSTCAASLPSWCSAPCSGTTALFPSTWAGASTCYTASSGASPRWPGSGGLYPILARWIAKIPPRPGKAVVWLLIAFMSVNMAVSGLALARYSARAAGEPADAAWEQYMDAHYGDDVMERIYPYAKMTG